MENSNLKQIHGLPRFDLGNPKEMVLILDDALEQIKKIKIETNKLRMKLHDSAVSGNTRTAKSSLDRDGAAQIAARASDKLQRDSKSVMVQANVVPDTALTLLTKSV